MNRSRVILGLLLVYQTLFLNILLPGHTRGVVTTDGKHIPEPCCCCCEGSGKPLGKEPAAPSQRDREHCAICEFAVGLISVPVIHFTLPELGLLEIRPIASTAIVISLDRISTYFACGPPASPIPLCV
jgi:hypothetical protein